MSSNLYEIYRANTVQLAKTLVIKSEASALALNQGLMQYGYTVDEYRPETWMYYLNLAGEYHDINEMMTVRSLDTLEPIDFTKANLLEHRATARAYAYGSQYYRELVRLYPDQTALIRGIINPVDLRTAIDADDHKILYYDRSLVEGWEENLISELQYFIDGFIRKYYHPDFGIVEDLYTAAVLAMLHQAIPMQIMLIRQRNCRTERVHSFHLWSYLGSHNHLDDYKDFLTREQAMWLYRDINYISHNWGKAETMGTLIDWIMTKRGFPIGMYDMYATDVTLLDTLYPSTELNFTPLNFPEEQNLRHVSKTVRDILEKEQSLGRDNPLFIDAREQEIDFKFSHGLMGQIPTKVLESEAIDPSLKTPIRLVNTLYNHWVSFSSSGLYSAIVTVQNPSNGDKLVMSVKDAVVAFLYCLNRSFGVTLKYVPTPEVWDVVRTKVPSFKTLRGLAEPYLISDEIIRAALDAIPTFPRLVSTENFYLKCVEIREMQLAHREVVSLREHFRARGQADGICRHLLEDRVCHFADANAPIGDFFAERSWDIEDLDDKTYLELAIAIITQCTGADLFYARSMAEIHAAMLRLFMELSSYSIHVIQTINREPGQVINWYVARVGDIRYAGGGGELRVPWMPAHAKAVRARGHAVWNFTHGEFDPEYNASVKMQAWIPLDIGLTFRMRGQQVYRIRVLEPTVWIRRPNPRNLGDVVTRPALDGLLDWSYINENGQTLTKPALDGLLDFTLNEDTHHG